MKSLCKKSFANFMMGIPIAYRCEEYFTPGKYYLAKITENSIEIEDNDGYEWHFTLVTQAPFYIWDYFYTLNEARKIKLEKLNEVTL